MSGPVVSVDGDVIRYSIGCVCDTDIFVAYDGDTNLGVFPNVTALKMKLGEDAMTKYKIKRKVAAEPVEFALHSCKMKLEYIRQATNARKLVVYLTGSGNFREHLNLCLPYKGNRVTKKEAKAMKESGAYPHFFEQYPNKFGKGKPTHFHALTDYMVNRFDAIIIDDMEVDDKLAMEQVRAWNWSTDPDKLREEGHIVSSVDKDLMQVPGWFFDFRPDDKRKADVPDWEFVTQEEADRNLWAQCISGDMTDNIYGVEGIALKGAKKLIEKGIAEGKTGREIRDEAFKEWFAKMEKQIEEGKELKPVSRHIFNNYTAEEYAQEVFDLVYLRRDMEDLNEIQEKINQDRNS